MNQNNSTVLQPDCNDNREVDEPKESDQLTPTNGSGGGKNKKNVLTPIVKSNSLHLLKLSPGHISVSSTSSSQKVQVTSSSKGGKRSKTVGKMTPSNGATSPVRGVSSPAMLTPTRSRLGIFSSPSSSHPHHLSRKGSRTVSYNGGIGGGSSYRQHVASRRAVIKMLGKK